MMRTRFAFLLTATFMMLAPVFPAWSVSKAISSDAVSSNFRIVNTLESGIGVPEAAVNITTDSFQGAISYNRSSESVSMECTSDIADCVTRWKSNPPILKANSITFRSVLGVCMTSTENWCIESVTVHRPGAQSLPATVGSKFRTSCATHSGYTSDQIVIPASDGCARSWSISADPTIPSFVVNATVIGSGNASRGWDGIAKKPTPANFTLKPQSMRLTIAPKGDGTVDCARALKRDSFGYSLLDSTTLEGSGTIQQNGSLIVPFTSRTPLGSCVAATDVSYSVTVRHGDPLSGWARGRLSEPGIKVSGTSGTYSTTFSGTPVEIPVTQVGLSCAQLLEIGSSKPDAPTGMENATFNMRNPVTKAWGKWTPMCGSKSSNPPNDVTGGYATSCRYITPDNTMTVSCRTLNVDEQLTGQFWGTVMSAAPKEQGRYTEWSAIANFGNSTIESANVNYDDPCAGGWFVGFTASNAAVFNPEPLFDTTTNSLSLDLASPHLDSSDQVQVGQLTTIVTKAFALCRWGIDPMSPSANVQMKYASTKSIEAVSSTLTDNGDSFTISVNGFHFSAPTAKIRMDRTLNIKTKSLKVKGGSKVSIRNTLKPAKGLQVQWHIQSGSCTRESMKVTNGRTSRERRVVAPKRGRSCIVMATIYPSAARFTPGTKASTVKLTLKGT